MAYPGRDCVLMVEDGRQVVPGYPAIETKQKLCHVCKKDEKRLKSTVLMLVDVCWLYDGYGCEQRVAGCFRAAEGERWVSREQDVVTGPLGRGDEEAVVLIVSIKSLGRRF